MFPQMATPNPRKRAAPDSSPAVQNLQMPHQQFSQPAPAMSPADADFLYRSQGGGKNGTYQDPAYNMNIYGGNDGLSAPPYDQTVPAPSAPSTQLARRPINRQLVQTGQRPAFDVTGVPNDPWGQFGDDALMDPQQAQMEENDNIELLEEKAAVAKRDAQAKRKQIPPFVQKLSR